MQPSENLYDQKPEEPTIPVSSPTTAKSPAAGSSFASRFEYVEIVQSSDVNSSGSHVVGHVAPPKATGFFAEFGMDGGFSQKASSSSSKVQVRHCFPEFIMNLACFTKSAIKKKNEELSNVGHKSRNIFLLSSFIIHESCLFLVLHIHQHQ